MERDEMRKSVTEFAAGGLFAFSIFSVLSFAVLLIGADSPLGFFKSLAVKSAQISSKDIVVSENPPETEEQPEPDEQNIDISELTDRLMLLSGSSGWGPTEAPEETEEPLDSEEQPSGDLKYPSGLLENGGRIIRRTYSYEPSSTCITLPGGGMLRNSTDISIDYIKEQVAKEPDLDIPANGAPAVIIMHTHTTECYEPTARERFDADFSLRTTELNKSVVAVGDEIAAALEAAGIGVIHDTTVHDYPRYTGAYDRSSETVINLLKENPTVKIVIDVHRDAIESEGVRYAPVCEVDGKTAAQVMIICGCTNVPQYRYNLRFASKLQSKLEKDYPSLTRPILFTERNYNQELTKASILIEMGSSSNSLEEAIYSGKLVGMSLAELIEDMIDD